ncbi:MAG: DivIVA domain-containing protein [Geodermatophilaceae bacterium]
MVDPRVPEALNPVRPLSIFGISLGAQGTIYALFIVGYRRSKPQAPHHPISVQEIRIRVRSAAIRDVAFSRARDGGRGYDEREVDTFVDLLQAEFSRLQDPSEVGVDGVELDVAGVVFHEPPPGKRGYDEREVDAYLDAVEAELARLRNPALVDVESQLPMATHPSEAMTRPSAPMSARSRLAVLIWNVMGLLALRSLLTFLLLDSLIEVRRRDTFGVSDEALVRREVVEEVFSVALLVVLAVCAIHVRRRARWARITAIVASVLTLLGAAIGLSPLYGSVWAFIAVNTLLEMTAVGACFCLIRAGRRAPAPVGSVE